jgi:hypothetical protein
MLSSETKEYINSITSQGIKGNSLMNPQVSTKKIVAEKS